MKKPGETPTARACPTRTIAISRPVGKGEETAKLVRRAGWIPFIFHTVELKPASPSQIISELSKALPLASDDWLVFMSPRGVDIVFDALDDDKRLRSHFGNVRALAVGPKTKDAISRRGVQDVAVPDSYSSAGIVEYLSRSPLRGRRIVLTRSSTADESLSKSLGEKGAIVQTIRLYESSIPSDKQSVSRFSEDLLAGKIQAVLFTSASSVSNLFRIIEKSDKERIISALKKRFVGAIGPVTEAKLAELGVKPIVPERYLIENAVKRLTEAYDVSMNQI